MAATEKYLYVPEGIMAMSDPAANAEAVTPHDSNELTYYTRGLYIGVTGDVVVAMRGDGSSITFKNAQAGSVIPIRCKIVKSTGTTATNLVAIY